MAESTAPHVSELAMADIERRLQWRVMPAFGFLGILALLLAAAFWPTVFPARLVAGLPPDPDVLAAVEELRGQVGIPSGELRWQSALTGDVPAGSRGGADEIARLARADRLLEAARPRLERDPRWQGAAAAIAVARRPIDWLARISCAARGRATMPCGRSWPETNDRLSTFFRRSLR